MKRGLIKQKKAQVWSFDLIVASIIFLSVILFFYLLTINLQTDTFSEQKKLQREANALADNLLSSGTPQNWNETNVVKIGIADDGKLNKTKLLAFKNLAESDYTRTKSLLGISDNYYINFTQPINANGFSIDTIGSVPSAEQNYSNLAVATRAVAVDGKIVILKVNVWS
ncbi:hypothetical protein D6817_01900 [Candidatus Pacearchaeota archaeon]|nr:MAG: hypothetical protein D6817_01900 [Candidatus Pacearchaeota archaeon]